jgi:hypothetical protein
MGPIVAVPEDVRVFVQWYVRVRLSRVPAKAMNKNLRHRLRHAVRVIRRANLRWWPAIAAYDAWKQAEWLAKGGDDGVAS